ncbi:MAG: alpha/beta hydrolase-fold protein [Bacteroidota bacterium]
MKKILLWLLPGFLIFGAFKAYRAYQWKQEEKRRATYYENLQDTSSPTVTSLRDSLLITYRQEKRTIHVYVPPSYATDTLRHYPVIYMLDGESSFNDLENEGPEWEIDEVINAAEAAGKASAIVIGINQAENRDAEYTPWINEDNPEAHGEQFTQWVAYELKPWVDASYRTQTSASATTIGGISRSGMMAYYMLMAEPQVFGNAIVQSPSMWVDRDRLFAMELTPEQLKDKKVFVSVGEYEGRIMIPAAEDIYEKFSAYGFGPDQVHYELIEGEGHWHLTWRKSFALAYPWLME